MKKDLRGFLADAGIQYRTEDGHVLLRATTSNQTFVYAKPLQREDGEFRADARAILSNGLRPQGVGRSAIGMGDFLRRLASAGRLEVTQQGLPQYQMFTSRDPIPTLTEATSQGVRAYRVGACDRLLFRLTFWEILDLLAAGIPPADLRHHLSTGRRETSLLSGLWEIAPAQLVCFPLFARSQPLAMVLLTDTGAQVALLHPAGGGFARPTQFTTWPVGASHASLSGSGQGIYKTSVRSFAETHSATMLSRCVDGANQLLSWLTDPAQWQTAAGDLDMLERWITWASIHQAIDALTVMGSEWLSPSSLWNALRALGILQGIWEGARQGSVPLRELLAPDHLRHHTAVHVPDATHREWTLGIIDNWEREIRTAFPNLSIDEALQQLEEIRHLVHGVGGQGRRPRDVRLETLRTVAQYQPNLQMLADVAVFWWSAVLFAPTAVCRPGRPPWAR